MSKAHRVPRGKSGAAKGKAKQRKQAPIETSDDVFIVDIPAGDAQDDRERQMIAEPARHIDRPIILTNLIEEILSGKVSDIDVQRQLKTAFLQRNVKPCFLNLAAVPMEADVHILPKLFVFRSNVWSPGVNLMSYSAEFARRLRRYLRKLLNWMLLNCIYQCLRRQRRVHATGRRRSRQLSPRLMNL